MHVARESTVVAEPICGWLYIEVNAYVKTKCLHRKRIALHSIKYFRYTISLPLISLPIQLRRGRRSVQPAMIVTPRVPRAVRRLKGAMGVSPHVGKSEGAKPRLKRIYGYTLPPSRYACHLPHGGRLLCASTRESTVVAGPVCGKLYLEVNAIDTQYTSM